MYVKWLSRERLREAGEFIFKNFVPALAFYVAYLHSGPRLAIALAVGLAIVVSILHLIFHWRISPFFIVASGFTVLLGSVDLCLESPRFYRLEPFAQNFLLGGIFALSLWLRMPLLEWFAENLPPSLRPQGSPKARQLPASPGDQPVRLGQQLPLDDERYFKAWTAIWAIYLWVKAALFLYLGLHVDLGRLVVLRSLIGGGSLAALIGVEILYRRLFREQKRGQPGKTTKSV